jgi:hypothetical protein
MEIARILNRSLIGANITACFLRNNFNVCFWCKVRTLLRGYWYVQNYVSRFGEHPSDALRDNKLTYLRRISTSYEKILIHHQYQLSPQEEVPKIMFQDVMYESIRPHGKFEALAWKSQIPPYYNYINVCEIRELETAAVKRKRSVKNGVVGFH